MIRQKKIPLVLDSLLGSNSLNLYKTAYLFLSPVKPVLNGDEKVP